MTGGTLLQKCHRNAKSDAPPAQCLAAFFPIRTFQRGYTACDYLPKKNRPCRHVTAAWQAGVKKVVYNPPHPFPSFPAGPFQKSGSVGKRGRKPTVVDLPVRKLPAVPR